jgi:hypothetical protein
MKQIQRGVSGDPLPGFSRQADKAFKIISDLAGLWMATLKCIQPAPCVLA